MDASNPSQTNQNDISPDLVQGLNHRELVPSRAWTAEELKFLVENRLSMSMKNLSIKMKKSRGSIAGKLHRLGLRTPKQFSRLMLSVGRKQASEDGELKGRAVVSSKKGPDGWKAIGTTFKRGTKALPQHMIEPPAGILDGVGVKMWMLEHHHCKWVVGEPSNLTCCGQNRHPNSPYCQDHHQIAYKGSPNG